MSSQRVGFWLLEVPDGASVKVDPSDGSHHFDAGPRYIYAVSNLLSAPAGVSSSAEALHRVMGKREWSYEMSGSDGFGWATPLPFEDGWYYLRTTREGDAVFLSCTLSYRVEADLTWALETWRGIKWSPDAPEVALLRRPAKPIA